MNNPSAAFADSTGAALIFLRAGTTGLLLILLGSLLFAANIFAMTFKWKIALLKSLLAVMKAPLKIGRGEIMKNGFSVFLAAFIALGLSWCGFVLAPVKQLGTAKQAAVLNSSDIYPVQRSGDATMGLQVYRANGCAACHTEQVRQDGVACDVVLTGAGKKNPAAVTQS